MRQRIKVASALVHDPPVLLLDEPFNGMDPRQRLQMMDLLRQMAAAGPRDPVLVATSWRRSSALAERVLVIVAGRLAASGDFREIRRLMTDRPHTFTVRSSDDRALASALHDRADRSPALSLDDGLITVRTNDFGAFSRAVSRRRAAVATSGLHELLPTDESLESVFSYLVRQ